MCSFGRQVFRDYSKILPVSQTLTFLANFQNLSTVGIYARIVPIVVPHIAMPFIFKHPIFVFKIRSSYNRGGLNPDFK